MIQPDRSGGAAFEDDDVVACYAQRPEYPPALYSRLLSLMPSRGRVLDLGCGTGKIARALAPRVAEVLAVDPSAAMLAAGKALAAGTCRNIRWTRAFAEDDLCLDPGSVDLAVAGASIHWMNPAKLFPALARPFASGAVMAIVDGDAPSGAPWLSSYQRVIRDWVERLGGAWNGDAHRALTTAHLPWIDVQGEESFTARVNQPLESLIACEHSRATWSRRRMGDLAEAFDADLRAALGRWATDGVLTFEVQTNLVWGSVRSEQLILSTALSTVERERTGVKRVIVQ